MRTGKRVPVRHVFLRVPARTYAKIESSMTERINGAGHFCQQSRIAITIARDHLTQAHPCSIARQSSNARPAFKGDLLHRSGNSVEVVVEPDRVISQCVGFLCDARHRLIRLSGVSYPDQVQTPSLRNNYAEIHRGKTPLFSFRRILLREACKVHLSAPTIPENHLIERFAS